MDDLKQWFPELTSVQIGKFKTFHRELIKFNRKLNLVSPATLAEIEDIHFADSIIAMQKVLFLSKSEENFDIGSGNGFPGVILAVLGENRSFVLLESDRRKAEFLKHVIAKLDLQRVRVFCERFETLDSGTIPCAVCRAFAPLDRSLAWAGEVFVEKGQFFHMKAFSWEKEIKAISLQNREKWKVENVFNYRLPGSNQERFLLLSEL